MRNAAKRISLMLLAVLLLISLAACGNTRYSKLGISFEIPSRLEPRAVAGAVFAYGDGESFIVFTRRTRAELSANGLSEINVSEFTDRFLTESGMKDSIDVSYSTDRAEFSYVVEDPEEADLYYYYYTVIMKGNDCIWIVQMSTYDALADKYTPDFKKWAASIEIE